MTTTNTTPPAPAPAPATAALTPTAAAIREYIHASYQALYVPTTEESRFEREITQLVTPAAGRPSLQDCVGVIFWDVVNGFSGPTDAARDPRFRAPIEALKAVVDDKGPFGAKTSYVFVFRDLDDFFPDVQVRRQLRTICGNDLLNNNTWRRPIIIISPSRQLHPKLKSHLTMIDFDLPDEQQLNTTFLSIKQNLRAADKSKRECSDVLQQQVVQGMQGLTTSEAENVLSRCLVRHGAFVPDMVSTIQDEKASIIKKSEVLTYIPESKQASRADIGGFGNVLDFIDRRRLAYDPRARALNLDYPKGIGLLGLPGSGKSYVAMSVARLLGLPGYIMDVGAIFGSLVGESEQRMREALKQIEAQKGCVLLVDEVDKALGGASESRGDGGTARRVFGHLLTWLAEKQDRTFVIVTLNKTEGLPPEFLRAGRFDAMFYTDLPTASDRETILKIHFRKRGVDPASLQLDTAAWAELTQRTHGFVGAELEEVVRESRAIAYQNRQSGTPTLSELMQAIASTTPLSVSFKDKLAELRTSYSQVGIRPASYEFDTGDKIASSRKARTRNVSVDSDVSTN